MVKEMKEASIARPSMSLFLPLLLFFPLLYSSACCSAQGNLTLTSDALALLDFKEAFRSLNISPTFKPWNLSNLNNICSNNTCSWHGARCFNSSNKTCPDNTCSWHGVRCSNSSNNTYRVSELRLKSKSLLGPIAGGLGRLDALRVLSLRENNLSGSLPADFVNLSALRTLALQHNDLSGPLPSNFSALPLLSHLDVSFNRFSGSIPTSLNSLTHLKNLSLQNNLFNGTISSLDIPSLKTFNVANNNLNGSIPGTLARFPRSSFTGNANLCGFPLEACKSNKLSKWAIVGIACGAGGAALLLLLLLCILLSRKRKEYSLMDGDRKEDVAWEEVKRESSATSGNKLVFIDEKQQFDLDDLLRASAEVLGKGTLGTTYKAVLENGLIVAVKRLQNVDESRRDEYRQRIHGIGRLKHDNLVPLRAYYLDKEENLVVYDFMQNGSLSALLHGKRETEYKPLDWEARMRIAATSAKGLAFLHAHDMVHGNVKSANVLLKSNLDACLADSCLSQILVFTPSAHFNPTGYLAPEITDPHQITPKADVFSFGVLLLELLTGKVPSPSAPSASLPSAPRSADPIDLPRWVQSVVREEWTAEVFDPSLVQSGHPFNEEEMVQLLQVAMSCVAPSPDQRPAMVDVVRMIDNIRRATDDDKSSDSYPEQHLAGS